MNWTLNVCLDEPSVHSTTAEYVAYVPLVKEACSCNPSRVPGASVQERVSVVLDMGRQLLVMPHQVSWLSAVRVTFTFSVPLAVPAFLM